MRLRIHRRWRSTWRTRCSAPLRFASVALAFFSIVAITAAPTDMLAREPRVEPWFLVDGARDDVLRGGPPPSP